MLKLKRYLKPYLILLLASVVLLFGQAMLELTLPNYMSDIVNIGLQQGGITEAAPEAIGADEMSMMQMFMSEEDQTTVQNAYVQLEEGSSQLTDLRKTYPGLEAGDWALTDLDNREAVNTAFSRAGYAFVDLMTDINGGVTESTDSASGEMNMEAIGSIMAAIQQPSGQEMLKKAIDDAAVTPDSMLSQTGVVFTKLFYSQLGADTDAIQTSYIWKIGLQMVGLTILLTACSIAAGFCLAKLGAGVGRDLRRDVFGKVTYFNNAEMDQFSTASLITRSTNDITQIQNFLSMGLRMLCFAPIMGIGGLIMGLSKCLSLAWVLALALIVMLGLILVLFSVALPRFKKMQHFIDQLNLVSREELSGLMVVRAFWPAP